MKKKPLLTSMTLLVGVLAVSLPGYADFKLSGVTNPIKRSISDHLQVIDFPCDSPAASAHRIQERSDAELNTALQALGFFKAQYRSDLVFDEKCWRLSYEITTGEPLIIREANIELLGEAAPEAAFQELVSAAELVSGAAFSSPRYEQLKASLQGRGVRQGFFDAKFVEQRVDIYPQLNAADIVLSWDSGERYRYGDIVIEQSVLEQGLFSDLLTLEPGDPYDLVLLQNDRIRLSESRYFGSVEITPLLDQVHDGQVPIQVSGTKGSRASYQVGVGYSTDTGARLRGDYTRHLINARGHQGGIKLLLSEALTTLNLNYKIPWRDPRTDSLRADLSYLDEDNDSFESERWEASITDSLVRASGWSQSVFVTLSTENSVIADEEDSFVLLVPGISWSRISADNLVYPNNGYTVSMEISGSYEGLVSDSSFAQIETSAKWIRALPYGLRLLVRGNLGLTLVDSVDDLPASRRFFSGGDNSIRGYEYQSLGPEGDGEVVGGRHLAVASIEVEHALYKKWSVAAFVDGGNAWDEGSFDPAVGVGLGLRWRSPIGPLRFDIGVPLEDTGDDFRVHLSFGPEL
jgi:translocation and assembly module TamA